MKGFTKDTFKNISASILKGSTKIFSGAWLNDMHGHLFEDAKGKIIEAINHARDRVWHSYSGLMNKDKDLINRGLMLDVTHASHMANYAKLISLSVVHNIHADQPAPALPKGNLWDAARKNWKRDQLGPVARAIYNNMPEDLQKRYRDEKRYAIDKQGDMAKIILDHALPMFDAPPGRTPEEVMKLAHDGKLEDADWDHYDKLGVGDVLQNAYRLAGKKDVYFNAQRNGHLVVYGRYDMPKGGDANDYSGEKLADNQREFGTEPEAHKYVTGTRAEMKPTVREVHYWTDAATGKTEQVKSDFATSDPGKETIRYRVSLERDNYQAATSMAEAQRNRVAMEAVGQGTHGRDGQAQRAGMVVAQHRRPESYRAQAGRAQGLDRRRAQAPDRRVTADDAGVQVGHVVALHREPQGGGGQVRHRHWASVVRACGEFPYRPARACG